VNSQVITEKESLEVGGQTSDIMPDKGQVKV
jgi:hypothetical protein